MAKERSLCCQCILPILVVFGVGLLISGVIVAVLGSFTTLADDEIKKSLPLKKGSTSFENWEKPEGDFFIEYYLFNITNIGNGTKPPQVNEIGPYTYRRISTTNVTKRLGQTITYDPRTEYIYDESRSCGGCDPIKDKITTVNYPLLVVLRVKQVELLRLNASKAAESAKKTDTFLNHHGINLFQQRTINEFLWGYQDAKFSLLLLNSTQPATYALQFNNSGSGIAKIHTGEHDVDRVTEYLEWKNYKTLPWWNSVAANMINGTGGTRFRPFIDKDDELYVLVTEICRSLKFTYDSTVSVHGIDLYRFTPPKEVFNNGDINPDNKGFCVTGPTKICLPSGLLDVNACKGGFKAPPFVASTPLFYNGDPSISEMYNLMPKKEKHATFIDIEPNTGLTMQGNKRLQLNFALPKSLSIEKMLLSTNPSDVIFIPSFYTDESAKISEEDADDFKKSVLLPLQVAKVMPYVMIGLGALLLISAAVIVILRRHNTKTSANGGKSELGAENYSMT